MTHKHLGVASLALLIGASVVSAATITFTESATATGSLGSASFTNSLITLTATGDTSNVTLRGPGWFNLSGIPVSITVASLGTTATLTDLGGVGACQNNSCPSGSLAVAGFSDFTEALDILDTFNGAFNTYGLTTSIGPVTGSSLINASAAFNTNKGPFQITSAGNATFTATIGTAQAISISNAGFESYVLNCTAGSQCYVGYVIPGWTVTGEVSTLKPSTGPGGEFPGGIPGGSNVAALGDTLGAGAITQDLGFAPSPNTTYTLTVSVGQRADNPLVAYAVELLVGTTSVASDSTLRPPAGTFALDTVTYNFGSSPGTGHLFIRLSGGGGGQADFDQVALNASSGATTAHILPQLAFGGGWYTALYFTNITNTPVSFTVSFIGDDGNPLAVPGLSGSSVTVNLAARGTALTEIPNAGPLVQGYVSAALPAGVAGYGVFRHSIPGVNDQEAVVPLSGTTATTSTLLFDDTNYITGVAVVNLASVSTTISVFARDNHGNTIGSSNIQLAAHAKTAVVLRDLPGLAGVAGALGSVDFTTSIGNLAALGLRFDGPAFTSIPTSDR